MIPASELKSFTREAAAIVARDKDVAQFEIYCASGDNRIARLKLHVRHSVPRCRGVEVAFRRRIPNRIVTRRNAHEVGTAYEAGDFSAEAIRAVLARAHRSTIVDPHFPGFPAEPRKLATTKSEKSDLARASDASLVDAAWSILRGAIGAFARAQHRGLVVGGDVSVFAIASRWQIRTSPISAPTRALTSVLQSPR